MATYYGQSVQKGLQVDMDFMQLVAEAVPGAIAGDVLSNGGSRDIVIGALLSGLASQWILSDETPVAKEVRVYFRQIPFLGLGAGYALARFAQVGPAGALGAGVLVAIGMMSMRKSSLIRAHDSSTPSEDAGKGKRLRAFPAIAASGESHTSSPAAIFDIKDPFE